MTKRSVILNFIKQFQDFGPDVINCFSNGMCNHFATILSVRFKDESPVRVYDPVINHFATMIEGRIYDITGDITDNPEYNWRYWKEYFYEDQKHTERIIRDCVWKVPVDTTLCRFCKNCSEIMASDGWGLYVCCLDESVVSPNHTCEKGEPK